MNIEKDFEILLEIITKNPYTSENIINAKTILKNNPGILYKNTINNIPLVIEILIAHEKYFQSLNWFSFLIQFGADINNNKLLDFIKNSRKSHVYKEIVFNTVRSIKYDDLDTSDELDESDLLDNNFIIHQV